MLPNFSDLKVTADARDAKVEEKVVREESSVIKSEMEFDPENTPRDPVQEGSRTDSVTSVSPEDFLSEQPGRSVTLEISLATMPVEILLHICHFLEAGVIINTLSKVCQAFHDLFTHEAYWRIRMSKRWPKKYPPVQCESDACSTLQYVKHWYL